MKVDAFIFLMLTIIAGGLAFAGFLIWDAL